MTEERKKYFCISRDLLYAKFCPICGTLISYLDTRCPRCGYKAGHNKCNK